MSATLSTPLSGAVATALPPAADAVFEGGGVKGIAFAGAIAAAEEAGVREWKNVAGTSAGAIAACLLAVGYGAADLERILTVRYRDFADSGPGGRPRMLVNALRMPGFAPGTFFTTWLGKQIEESPLARRLGKTTLTFADVARPDSDFAPDVDAGSRERARYRLRVIASDVSAGRMLVLPQDIGDYALAPDGPPLHPDTLELVTAVRMSMSFPFLYTPVGMSTVRTLTLRWTWAESQASIADWTMAIPSERGHNGIPIVRGVATGTAPVPGCSRKPQVGRAGGRSPLSNSHTGKFESRPPSTIQCLRPSRQSSTGV
jgi:hypothetical protein